MFCIISKPVIIFRTYRIVRRHHVSRFCGSIGEEIEHVKTPEVPFVGKADATTNGRVVESLICRRWVETNKEGIRCRLLPDSPK
jgi:hypothetical protein